MAVAEAGAGAAWRWLAVAAVLAVNTLAAIALWQSYADAEARAVQRTQALAQIYAEVAFRSLESYDQVLLDVQGLLADGVPPATLSGHLRRQKVQHVNLLNVFIFDAHGGVAAGTQDRAADLSDRDYVVAHRDDPDVGRYVGRPALSRLFPGRRFFPMSRRLSGPEGELTGVVAATIDLKDMAESFEAVREGAEGPDTAIALIHHDGTLYVRSPAANDQIGRKFTLGTLGGDRVRTVYARSPFDDSLRILTQRQVPRYPLVVVASVPHQRVLADWADTAVPVAGVALALTAAVVALVVHVRRRTVRQERLAQQLVEAGRQADAARAAQAQAQAALLRSEGLAQLAALVPEVAGQGDGVPAPDAAPLVQVLVQVAHDQLSGCRRSFSLGSYVSQLLLLLNRGHHRVDLYMADDVEMDSYPGALAQVLTNLLLNSWTHGFDDGRMGVVDIAARRDGSMVELIYSDNGRGIPPALHARVFEPFFTSAEDLGCKGLGLTLVHHLVTQVLGGTLVLDSQTGRGVHYTLRLPLRAPDRFS